MLRCVRANAHRCSNPSQHNAQLPRQTRATPNPGGTDDLTRNKTGAGITLAIQPGIAAAIRHQATVDGRDSFPVVLTNLTGPWRRDTTSRARRASANHHAAIDLQFRWRLIRWHAHASKPRMRATKPHLDGFWPRQGAFGPNRGRFWTSHGPRPDSLYPRNRDLPVLPDRTTGTESPSGTQQGLLLRENELALQAEAKPGQSTQELNSKGEPANFNQPFNPTHVPKGAHQHIRR
jgi:hypothetical protein